MGMRDTPVPEANLEFERLRVAAALQRARSALLARPEPQALDLAQAALFPLLQSLGVDIFDLRTLRLTCQPTAQRASFRLVRGEEVWLIEVHAAGERLDSSAGPPKDTDWLLLSNGRRWLVSSDAGDRTEDDRSSIDRVAFELFHQSFALVLDALLRPGAPVRERLLRADEMLRAEAGPEAGPLERITLEEVLRHAQQVRHLHGRLEAFFDGQEVAITSRSAFYYVLAALALRHGREDAIPGEDLVRPPDEPPALQRALPLGRPGWHLLLEHHPAALEERTERLLDALGLHGRVSARLKGKPYPGSD
jgi:hypothetical protein